MIDIKIIDKRKMRVLFSHYTYYMKMVIAFSFLVLKLEKLNNQRKQQLQFRPAAAFTPPVKAPINPIFLTSSIAPFARL